MLFAVFFYVRYGVSYRDLEEILEERGVNVDHATLNRRVVRYSTALASGGQKVQTPSGDFVEDGRNVYQGQRRGGLPVSCDMKSLM